MERICTLDQYKQATLLKQAFRGDYRTPTCAACGIKMVERKGSAGAFWGCQNYPGCKVRLSRNVWVPARSIIAAALSVNKVPPLGKAGFPAGSSADFLP